MAVEIDSKKLPTVSVIDSGVLFLSLHQRDYRPDSPTCRALWRALVDRERLATGARVLIPAPVLAELLRGTSKQEPPRVPGVFVAPFTAKTARYLVQHVSHAFIEAEVASSHAPRAYVKYDAMIAATAIAYEATLIALDGWFHRQTTWPIAVKRPQDFVMAQTSLPLP